MAKKTHQFTRNSSNTPIIIVIDKIRSIEKDHFSDCTTIIYLNGDKIGVSETEEEVQKIIENSK